MPPIETAARLAAAAALGAFAWLGAGPALAQPVLDLPIDCRLGETCFIQNYVDDDPSPSAKDYKCGTRTYEAHNGVDFRLPTLADQKRGVTVRAAAAGRVTGLRDEMDDVSVRERGVASVEGKECGNGVVVDHGDGWASQYCHMQRGSIAVKTGDRVTVGQTLGKVGLSGMTEYPHLHFTLRKDGKVVDPFAYGAAPGACGGGQSLWAPTLSAALAYQPRAVLNAGFATGPVTMEAIEAGSAAPPKIDAKAEALVAFVRVIGLQAGDVSRITIFGPDGQQVMRNDAKPQERDQAQTMLFAGRKRPERGFAPGVYRAVYEAMRDGAAAFSHAFTVRVAP
ncbi:M23 family metallopeptidase [Alsobacter sp. SYSU M60028]|uniref:M23 family metallopeptidase n=1 Tax=Alsobacter ponti TaxID=2962936 RepID=A0ABT1LDJ6_9HYPH|nr:M23 family metallopeptidase [Alsobacter ponti]MCP8939176.1 M23 family metallopeptidase [Alsobacter ponti]